MSGFDVDTRVLGIIATSLDEGASGLENLAGTEPAAVDAGPMSAVITSMLAQILDSAGNVSAAMSTAAEAVRLSRTYYERADADAEAGLEEIRRAMEP